MASLKGKKRRAEDSEVPDHAQPAAKKSLKEKSTTGIKPEQEEAANNAHDGNAGNKGRKRKRKVKREDNLSPEEQQRRQEQRDSRNMALQMRSEGKAYKRPPPKKRKVEVTKARQPSAKTSKFLDGKEETGHRPSSPVQVIVIPIFWNRKPEEKAQVIRAAENIIELLKAQEIEAGIDTTVALSPGQKYAYWEAQGVKIRVECGPNDVPRRSCVVAVSKNQGELAERQTLQVGPKLRQRVASLLGIHLKDDHGISKEEEVPTKEVNNEVGQKRAALTSGDELGGDFEGLDVEDPASERKTKKKKRLS